MNVWLAIGGCFVSACAGAIVMCFFACSDIDHRITRAHRAGYTEGYEAGKYDGDGRG